MFAAMRPRLFHMIVCLLLVALAVSERAMSCDGTCRIACADERTPEPAYDQAPSGAQLPGRDHAGDRTAGTHHCEHCICPCHAQAVTTTVSTRIAPPIPVARYAPSLNLPPSAPVDPLDHIPLS
jgi:hypothetical protein